MPEIVLTEQAREHLDSIGLELERLQSETAILVGEVGWRQIASSGESGERELVEHGGFTAEEIPLLRSLAEGREPVRATIVFSEDEEAEIQHEALSLQEEDARNNRLQYEIAALFERAEEVATAAAVERTAARRQYSASREKKITKFLRGLRDKSPEMMREFEEFFYEPREHNRCTWMPQGNGLPDYVYDLEEARWHVFKGLEEKTERRFPFTTTLCGLEMIGGPAVEEPKTYNRAMVLAHIATTAESDMSICEVCLPDLERVPRGFRLNG